MIGFYDYTVILTYLSLASAIGGMFSAFSGHLGWSICFLALSGLLDTFDGKVARTKKNRTDQQKRFGIQIDSLCDVICFGVLPIIICWYSGMQNAVCLLILILYCLAGLIRLAFYNVMEEERQQETDEKRKYYQGLPITSIAVLLPLTYAASTLMESNFVLILSIVMLVTAFLFIFNFKFPKPNNRQLTIIILIVLALVIYLIFHFNWRAFGKWTEIPFFWKPKG